MEDTKKKVEVVTPDKEQVGTVMPHPKPFQTSPVEWIPDWVPGVAAIKKAAKDLEEAKKRIETGKERQKIE